MGHGIEGSVKLTEGGSHGKMNLSFNPGSIAGEVEVYT